MSSPTRQREAQRVTTPQCCWLPGDLRAAFSYSFLRFFFFFFFIFRSFFLVFTISFFSFFYFFSDTSKPPIANLVDMITCIMGVRTPPQAAVRAAARLPEQGALLLSFGRAPPPRIVCLKTVSDGGLGWSLPATQCDYAPTGRQVEYSGRINCPAIRSGRARPPPLATRDRISWISAPLVTSRPRFIRTIFLSGPQACLFSLALCNSGARDEAAPAGQTTRMQPAHQDCPRRSDDPQLSSLRASCTRYDAP